ncbi:DUF5659 domain-containing protein [Clostridium tertium]|jgi:hypothetical protein|uniref:DUF5659 domain-containing protein n=1 Tax=Clostridium tertium TaxID=1559 RepID=UPI000BE3CE93|nr:DUF5659 domain-containing protein [Clostridium tertium]
MRNTRDITDKDLMVYLLAKGFQIENIKKDGNKSIVTFKDHKDLEEATIKFVNREDVVNIADLLAAEKRIKTILCMNSR